MPTFLVDVSGALCDDFVFVIYLHFFCCNFCLVIYTLCCKCCDDLCYRI